MKILVVDDSKSIHAFLTASLNKPNIELVHVFNGKEASDRLLGAQEKYDLVMLDWEMPVQTGPETLKLIREAKNTTPVLMMTTKNAIEDITQMLQWGANEYMLKPFTTDILFEKIAYASGMEIDHAA